MKKETVVKRDFMGFEVRQKLNSGYYCATDLLKLFNAKRRELDLVEERMNWFFCSRTFDRFVRDIGKELKADDKSSSDPDAVSKKKASVVGIGIGIGIGIGDKPLTLEKLFFKKKGMWMHPYLFMKFAMWLDVEIETKVTKKYADEQLDW